MDAAAETLTIDLKIYRLEAVKKAAYKFGDKAHITLETAENHGVRVTLRAKRVLDNPAYLAGEFQNEVLDQELREVVAAETKPIRDLLLAQAFSATNLVHPDLDHADYRNDSEVISRPEVTP